MHRSFQNHQKVKRAFIASLFIVSAATAAHVSTPHTDGIEPYYPPDAFANYLKTVPDPDVLFAGEGDMDWWTDARFASFICWGPSSMLECSLGWGRKGPRPGHPSDGTVTRGVPQEIYDDQYKHFAAPDFDADEWVKLVRDSGAKYLVWLTKHHDGFCMFDTKLTDYNIMNTPFGRDATKEIVDACHKYGIKVALYYSQPDWYNPIYATGDKGKYCEEYLFPQIRELLTNYGKIDVMWFDGLGLHPDTWKAPALLKMIRSLQPGIIVNHRFGPRDWHVGDFDGPERSIGRFQSNRPWETCSVIGGGWAWMGDAPAMPLPQAISLLVRCAGGDGNLALGFGPNGDGLVLPDHKKRLLEMGEWLKQYGETIYGTQGGPYMPGPWGAATCKGDTVYLHVLANWSGTLTLPSLPAKVLEANVLANGNVKVVQNRGQLRIELQPDAVSEIDTVIALKLDRPASEIAPIKTVDLPLTIGATATASSERSENHSARSFVASDLKEFSEGIMVKSAWSPARDDKAPWIQVTLAKPESVDQIQIREGKFGSPSRVEQFVIEAKVSKDWKTIHEGTSLGGDFGLVLPEPVTSDTFRIRFVRWKGAINVNSLELFKGE
ncbi:alpha-L-fucosidase [Pontiella sulfatireligans]|uniref:alpha-L-fucosidase n=1 Tax=Pontiella sulfatireligans TaxID=2750658 RepID=A0A6C2UEJ7_9BACT|nr:alpha-L-fucosidase [Pontiella sulfatireligans]VGO18600.1 hypothetical protein SCARR_00653 [Pontiella sulfatireligans]